MSDDKETKDALDMAAEAAAPRRARAPPKGPPPEAKERAAEDKQPDEGGEKKKKKALPPPSNPPPQGATSAVAAVRAKGSLPPPSGPPPSGAAPSASVAKIRGAARPPSSGPPPTGAKPVGAPPSTAPPNTRAMAPPPKSDAKDSDDSKTSASDGTAKDVASPRAAPAEKKIMRPPSASATPTRTDAESKPKRSPPAPAAKPTPQRSVDVFGEFSASIGGVDDDAIASVPFSSSIKEKSPPKITLSSSVAQPTPSIMRATSPPAMSSYPNSSASTKTQAPRKSTLDVLNDTTASINRGTRTTVTTPVAEIESERPSTAVAASAGGRAVPFSGSSRPNVPEDEVILVKKHEHSKGKVSIKLDAKKTIDLEESIEDVEEIPFLEEAKPGPKHSFHGQQQEPRRMVLSSHDEDPEIVIESKTTAPSKAKAAPADAKPMLGSDPKVARDDKEDHDDRLLAKPAAKEAEREDVYNELRKLKRNSLTDDNLLRDGENQDGESSDPEAKRYYDGGDGDALDEDKETDWSSRDSKRERRREKRRHSGPKKITAQFFNPKSVPFMPDHLLEFVKHPLECGRGHIIKCFIERNEQNKLAPIFTLLLEVNSVSGRPIMYAKKKGASRITSHYVISLNKEDLALPRMMRSHQYIGKLRSSTSLMEYCLYDQGDNPEDLDSDCEMDDELRKSIRAELAVIKFHHTKKPYARKMEVVIPAIVDNGSSYLDWRPLSRDQMMEEHMRAITTAGGQNVLDTQNFTFMHKRETKYDPLSSCIVDFRSRATCTSVKNFQLVHSEPMNEEMKERYRKLHPDYVYEDQGTVSLPQEHVLLQLGKVGKHCFNMDFQYPLSMLQAFAICLARFDSKQR